MTHQSFKPSVLTHSKPLLMKCLQAALIAAPVMLAAAPSHALTLKTTVTGFNGSFAPSAWLTNVSNGSITWNGDADTTATTLTLRKSASSTGSVNATSFLDQTLIDALKPSGAGDFIGYSYKYDWDWSFTTTGTTNLANNNSWTFSGLNDEFDPGTVRFNTSAPLTGVVLAAGTMVDTTFGFDLARVTNRVGTGTGIISNFEFIAEYDVPGPLPIAGAAAAFAWSRRLRSRLNAAKTLG